MAIELKFFLSEGSYKALEAELRLENARSQMMTSIFFDTHDRDLGKEGLSLSLRKQGRIWFQTLKSTTSVSTAMLEEHEIRLGAIPVPKINLGYYQDTDIGNRLEQLLQKSSSDKLVGIYSIEIRRVHVRAGLRTCVEYALDSGKIIAKPRGRRSPILLSVSEIELELISGPVSGLFTYARKILREHEAWIDVRSKAKRGEMLAVGKLTLSPTKSVSSTLENKNLNVLIDTALSDCIHQILQNSSQIASQEGGEAEHLRQLRVGLRRLRGAIRLFGKFLDDRIKSWEPHAKLLASSLGCNRDIDMMADIIWPNLRGAEAPLVELPLQDMLISPANIIRDPKVQNWLLDLIEFEFRRPGKFVESDWKLILPTFRRWYREVRNDAIQFNNLNVADRHQLRKKLKRLRYTLQFVQNEFPKKRYSQFSRSLKQVVDNLGYYNDLQVAMKHYLDFAEFDHRALFAVGWLKAQILKIEIRCARSLINFYNLTPPWVK